MTFLASQQSRPIDKVRRGPHRAGRIETLVTVVSVCAIAVLIAVDVVRTAPPDAPVVAVTFDVAPPGDWLPAPKAVGDHWGPDDSAQGTRPDAAH